jgi:hypothetical protein
MMMRIGRLLATVLAALGLAVVAVPSPASAQGWASCVPYDIDGGTIYEIKCLGDGPYDIEITCYGEPPNNLGTYSGQVEFLWRCLSGLDHVRAIPTSW